MGRTQLRGRTQGINHCSRAEPELSACTPVVRSVAYDNRTITEARICMDRALELEPYFWVIQNLNAWIYYFEGKYEKAIEACTAAHDLNSEYIENNWLFFLNYAKLGEGEKAMSELQTIARTHPDQPGSLIR